MPLSPSTTMGIHILEEHGSTFPAHPRSDTLGGPSNKRKLQLDNAEVTGRLKKKIKDKLPFLAYSSSNKEEWIFGGVRNNSYHEKHLAGLSGSHDLLMTSQHWWLLIRNSANWRVFLFNTKNAVK